MMIGEHIFDYVHEEDYKEMYENFGFGFKPEFQFDDLENLNRYYYCVN